MSRSATQRRTKMHRAGYAVGGSAVRGCLALMVLESPPMSLTRDTDLAQRTVALFRGAREGESFSFGVLTAVKFESGGHDDGSMLHTVLRARCT
jgi:hypothetical protein